MRLLFCLATLVAFTFAQDANHTPPKVMVYSHDPAEREKSTAARSLMVRPPNNMPGTLICKCQRRPILKENRMVWPCRQQHLFFTSPIS
ncbi:hypothetical protein CesoFtcFv8_026095 [Champsocephalus esox]|uniref:Secreted protein n=1 Tax=Champsocephalus esox TaxID=159716 RepID=A0AAN8GBY6_9TELE|nr:hypothetical protein CesoFtcFv8_026095 [Champsocephalus esox]